MATETGVEIAIERGIVTEIGVEAVVIENHEVLATSISRTLGASAGAIGAVRKMEEISEIPILSAIDQLVVMIAGRNLLEMIAGKTIGMTGWVAADGRIEAAEAAEEARSTGRFRLTGMNDWSWSCLVLAILGLILANMRISQLRLPEKTYRHTSHL